MKSAKLTILLALLATSLLAMVVWQAKLIRDYRLGFQSAPNPSPSSSAGSLPANEPSSPATDKSNTFPSAEGGVASSALAMTNTLKFDWRQIESEDYRSYIQNLRRIGCPEETVRDIVKADVVQAYAAQRANIMAEHYRNFAYWKSDTVEAAARGELEQRQREVDTATRSAIHELLGAEVLPPSTTAEWRQAELTQQLGFLPADTRDQTIALLQQYAEVDAQIKELSGGHPSSESPSERLQVIESDTRKREALNALLTPEEFELVDMTTSWTATNLRRAMAKFQPTEEEFRAIFREWRAQDEQLAVIFAKGQPDPGNAQVFAGIKQVLSPERYEKYRATWWK